MKHRGPIAVFFLSIITLGIYSIVWQVKTKGEMNRLGASIPTAWLIIIPFVNWWWLWKYSEGVELVTKNEMSKILAFILLFLLGAIGMAIIQNEFNSIIAKQMQGVTAPSAPVTPAAPVGSTPPAAVPTATPATPAAPASPTDPTPPTPPNTPNTPPAA